MRKNTEREDRKKRKILVPLATLTVAAAVAVGSGATFTSQSGVHASITAGKLIASNNHDQGTLHINQLKPGDSATGTVTLTEDAESDLNSTLAVNFSNVTSDFATGAVTVTVTGNGDSDSFDLEAAAGGTRSIDLGTLTDQWGSTTVDITVSMDSGAGNGNQGVTGAADLAFVLTATDGSTDHETTATWTP